MITARHRCVIALACTTLALAAGCQTHVWLSDELDAHTDPDAGVGPDAPFVPDSPPAPDAGPDAGGARACESAPVPIALLRASGPLEEPTFATSGRDAFLRYGLLVPPSARTSAGEDTLLVVTDSTGNVLHERALRLEDATGAAVSTGTLHSLAAGAPDQGFLVLSPTALVRLDHGGAGALVVPLTTAPSPTWQRAAGWLDADRFVFVTDTADLRLAVYSRLTGAVEPTSISASGAAIVHVEPGGITISREAAPSETRVYDPDLSGAEILRSSWDEGVPLGNRLIATALSGSTRTWIVRDPNEFRTAVTAYEVPTTGAPIPGSAVMLVSPIRASLEDTVIAISGFGPSLTLYSLSSRSFTPITARDGSALVEPERDGAHVSVLTLRPSDAATLSAELDCAIPAP